MSVNIYRDRNGKLPVQANSGGEEKGQRIIRGKNQTIGINCRLLEGQEGGGPPIADL